MMNLVPIHFHFQMTQLSLFLDGVVGVKMCKLMRLLLRGNFPGWGFITPGLWCALLWPVVSAVLLLPQRQPPDQDENRPL